MVIFLDTSHDNKIFLTLAFPYVKLNLAVLGGEAVCTNSSVIVCSSVNNYPTTDIQEKTSE